jgi:hypothetical protein
LPSFIYAGATPRFYPQELGADGKSLTAVPGTVHVWAEAPADGQWLTYGDASAGASNQPNQGADMGAPAEIAPQEPEAPEPAPEPVTPPPAPEPVPVLPQTPESAPEPVPVQPEPAAPAPTAFQFPGFAPAAQPYTR